MQQKVRNWTVNYQLSWASCKLYEIYFHCLFSGQLHGAGFHQTSLTWSAPPLVALSPVFNPQRRPAVNQRINWSLGGRGLEYSEPFVTQRCRPSPTATLLFLSCRLQPLQFMLGTASGTVSICSALMWQKNLICALISISESKLKNRCQMLHRKLISVW